MSLFTYYCGCFSVFDYLVFYTSITVVGLFLYFIGRTIGYDDGWVSCGKTMRGLK
jgi:hypothetical protein